MATRVLTDIANYLATVPLQRKQQQYENELANRRLALQEDEAARKAEADKLALENAQFEQQQRNEGQSALGEYNRAAEIQPSINELKQGKELTKNVVPYSMDYLLAQPEATPLALTDKYKLSQYAPYNAGAKGTLEQLNKEEEQRIKESKASTGLGMTTQIKRDDWNKIAAMPDGEEKDKAIDNYMMVYAPGQKYPLSEKGINEKINLEKSLIPVKSETEKYTTKAGKIGGIEGETEANQTAIPGFKPIQGVNITNDSVKKVKTAASQIETMKSLADDLIKKYDKMGSVFTGDDAADYSSKVRNLQLMAKGPEFYNLGVLTGPDLSLLEETIPNPASIKEGVKKTVLGDISVKLNNFKNMLDTKSSQFYQLNGFEKDAPKKKKVYNPATGKFELR